MKERTTRRAVSAGAVFAGIVVAVLQVLQQTLNVFHPRQAIYVLFAAIAFVGGLLAARLRNRHTIQATFDGRQRHLGDLLGIWPASSILEADPVRLGVFPASRTSDAASSYVPRELDSQLRAVMVSGAAVLVVGTPRAGVSRTTLEAARAALPTAAVITPRTPAAVGELAALDPPLDIGDRPVLVWLDGLDRYAEAIDAESLRALNELGAHVTIVATLRRELWEEWLMAEGANGQVARALTARASIFELAEALSQTERGEAERLYPGVDVSAGIGRAIASRGKEGVPPPRSRSGEQGEVSEPSPLPVARKDPQLVATALGTIAATVALAIVWIGSGFEPLSINQQFAAIQREGSRTGRYSEVLAATDLQDSGVNSRVLLFRDRPGTKHPSSDELRIYDEEGGKLIMSFQFRPDPPRAVFQPGAVTDVDFDGAPEIVGGYGHTNVGREAVVPFVIDWDGAAGRYRMVPLDLGPPVLSHPSKLIAETQYRRIYAPPTTFVDSADHRTLTGHLVQGFTVTSLPHRLVAGWFLLPWLGSQKAKIQLSTAIFDRSSDSPHLTPCTFTGQRGPMIVASGLERSLAHVFEEAYDNVSRHHYCNPVYG